MDKDEREDEKRDAPNVSETKKKDRYNILFAQLRAFLQTHGYPVKGDREKNLQSTSALSQEKEDQDNPETSGEISDWIPSFHSYDEFNRMILQSLGSFIIILSADGVIIFAAESVSSLLGYSPDEMVGKKLLNLLPEQEKREVFRKICFKLPVSNSVGRRMEFCCHLKRGNLQGGDKLSYEYAKFIMSLKDISDEPLVLLSRFFPSPKYVESSNTQIPLEDRFYIVGTVCIFRTQTLWKLLTVKETGEHIRMMEPSDEENSSIFMLHVQDLWKKVLSVVVLLSHSLPTSLNQQDQVDIEEAEQYGSQESAHTSCNASISSLETTQSSATSSSQNFEFEPVVEEMEQVEQMDQMDEIEEVEEEPLKIASPIAAYINKREIELMKKFKKQLEEKTQMLQADIRNQKEALEMMKEQLNTLRDSKFQQYLKDQEQYLQLLQKQQPQQCNIIMENQRLQISLLNFSGPLYDEFLFFMQIQSIDVPLQLVAEEQDKNLGGQEDERQSLFPEDQQKQNLLPLAHNPGSEISPVSFSQSPISSDSDLVTLETTQDYIRLWHKTSDPQSHLKFEVKSWPCSEQDQDTRSEALVPEAEAQGPSGPQSSQGPAEYPPDKISSYLSSEESESDE